VPTVKLYANGMTMGSGNPAPSGGKRGAVVGWSASAVRRHTRWLYSVDAAGLGPNGFAVTLTIRDCPETAAEWQALRSRYLDDLTRTGVVVRTHWVTEWTRRKVPHLHLAVYLEPSVGWDDAERVLIDSWLHYAARYGTGRRAQHMARIVKEIGWLEYLSKHAARGVGHYQRQGSPSGWDKTGRLWGHSGNWPVSEPIEGHLDRETFWRFRRLVRAHRVAAARSKVLEGKWSPGSIVRARGMLRCDDRALSSVRGVSEWIPESVGLRLLDSAAD
jgi:hypothetical protein